MSKIEAFRGLNNVVDPMRLDMTWLARADNIDITDTGAVKVRDGYTKSIDAEITGGYSTVDHQRAYVVQDSNLCALTSPTTTTALRTGLSTTRMHWAEINNQVFYNNGVDAGIIQPDNTLLEWAWTKPPAPSVSAVAGSLSAGQYQVRCTLTMADGRMTGASAATVIDLTDDQALSISDLPAGANVYITPANSTSFFLAVSNAPAALYWNFPPNALNRELAADDLYPLPQGCGPIQFWNARAFAAQEVGGDSVVWFSQPFGFHLFNLAKDVIPIPGKVLMLAPHEQALVIGTDSAVYAYDGKGLKTIAEYGVIPGKAWAVDDSDADAPLYIWTQRGMCRYPEFANLTQEHVSVAPGVHTCATVVQTDGQKRFVVNLHQGGSPFNKRL